MTDIMGLLFNKTLEFLIFEKRDTYDMKRFLYLTKFRPHLFVVVTCDIKSRYVSRTSKQVFQVSLQAHPVV